MRRAVSLLLTTAVLAAGTPVLAADKPAIDLVAAFVLGIEDGTTLGINGGGTTAVAKQTAPGTFTGTPEGGQTFIFEVSEAGKCLYDIKFTLDGSFVGGIEVDANKLNHVAYEVVAEHAPTTDFKIDLVGADGVVQLLGPAGEHAPTESNSTLTTSLTADQMQAAVTSLQAECPAAAA